MEPTLEEKLKIMQLAFSKDEQNITQAYASCCALNWWRGVEIIGRFQGIDFDQYPIVFNHFLFTHKEQVKSLYFGEFGEKLTCTEFAELILPQYKGRQVIFNIEDKILEAKTYNEAKLAKCFCSLSRKCRIDILKEAEEAQDWELIFHYTNNDFSISWNNVSKYYTVNNKAYQDFIKDKIKNRFFIYSGVVANYIRVYNLDISGLENVFKVERIYNRFMINTLWYYDGDKDTPAIVSEDTGVNWNYSVRKVEDFKDTSLERLLQEEKDNLLLISGNRELFFKFHKQDLDAQP